MHALCSKRKSLGPQPVGRCLLLCGVLLYLLLVGAKGEQHAACMSMTTPAPVEKYKVRHNLLCCDAFQHLDHALAAGLAIQVSSTPGQLHCITTSTGQGCCAQHTLPVTCHM
jgi:hypothetical protein